MRGVVVGISGMWGFVFLAVPSVELKSSQLIIVNQSSFALSVFLCSRHAIPRRAGSAFSFLGGFGER